MAAKTAGTANSFITLNIAQPTFFQIARTRHIFKSNFTQIIEVCLPAYPVKWVTYNDAHWQVIETTQPGNFLNYFKRDAFLAGEEVRATLGDLSGDLRLGQQVNKAA